MTWIWSHILPKRMSAGINLFRQCGLRRVIRTAFQRQLESYRLFLEACCEKRGLEIGGPSGVFRSRGVLPLYGNVRSLDNCLFARQTLWEGAVSEGNTFVFDRNKPAGFQHIIDGTELNAIESGAYDFVLSSHNLEHMANPIKALKEWQRVAKHLVLILPYYLNTFDHRRRPTSVAHIVEDFERNVGEDDLTHIPEVIELHDLSRDLHSNSRQEFAKRCWENSQTRSVHHHVFDEENSQQLVRASGYEVLACEVAEPWHIAILARTASVAASSSS